MYVQQVPWDKFNRFMFLPKVRIGLVIVLFATFFSEQLVVFAQQQQVNYRSDLFFSGASENSLPFWLGANQFGVIDNAASNSVFRFATDYGGAFGGNKVTYTLGLDFVGRTGDQSTVFFQQFYGELRWGIFKFFAGKKERTTGEVHESLSLGSMLLSRNAAPVSHVSVSWPEFVDIPGTGRFLGVRGYLGHGWIEGARVVNDPYLHEKHLYLRLGMPSWPIEARAGILHYTLWGGIPVRENRGDRLPSSFSDFLRVFFIQGAAEGIPINGERTNVLGNSLGAYDFSLRVNLSSVRILAYRQFYLEDTVSLAFRNGWDGIWGLGFDFKGEGLVDAVLWEHVNTKRQSSKKGINEPRGTDNYYNHFIYESGWTHRGRTLGMPLILTSPGFEGNINNILLAHHLGIEGSLRDNASYKMFLTYSRNYGAHSILEADSFLRVENARFATPVHRYAFLFEGYSSIFPSIQLDAFARIGYDWGDDALGPKNNLGITLGVTRKGAF